MQKLFEDIYDKSPVLIQNLLISLYGVNLYRKRYSGNYFKRLLKEIEQEPFFSKEKIESHQLEELKKILKHAYENVPFYKDEFDRRKIKYQDIRNINDINALPIVEKDMIQKEPNRFYCPKLR